MRFEGISFFLLPLIYDLLEPSRRLTLEVDSDVCDSNVRDGFFSVYITNIEIPVPRCRFYTCILC
jgi:hypothetical protein